MPDEETKDFHKLDIPRNPDEEGLLECGVCGLTYPRKDIIIKKYAFRSKEYVCSQCNQIMENQGM